MITKKNIEELANKIKDLLIKNECYMGVCIYYNNKRMKDIEYDGSCTIEDDVDPHDYLEYCAKKHILSMSFEGSFNHIVNYYDNMDYCTRIMSEFENILDAYGVYFEQGEAWNLSVYPSKGDYENYEYSGFDDEANYDSDTYTDDEQRIGMYNIDDVLPELKVIMIQWYDASSKQGNIGSCVLGAGYHFEYKDAKYFMSSCSPWQGSLSWENTRDETKRLLETIGASNIRYEFGVMD